MSISLLSPHWYRISMLRPRLRAGVRLVRHVVRGQEWVVLTDPVSGRHHRFDRVAWTLLSRCDGRRTLDEAWTQGMHLPDAPTQDQAIRVVSQAFAANLLLGDVTPEAAAVMRAQQRERQRRRRAAINPLAFRVPLWDPDAFLSRHGGVATVFSSRGAVWAWGVLVAMGALLLAANAAELGRHVASLAASPRFWLLAWLLYPVIKVLHEFAHAFAVKRYGGEVHVIGLTMLMLTPVPYVDASASAAFADKRQRAAVAAAGIAVELALASVALALWCLLEPGWVRDAAAVVATVAGVSTLLVNGNPLLRFDGYHVAADLLELPNLASRSARWWRGVLQRRALGLRTVAPMALAPGERGWLAAYAPLSWTMQALLLLGVVVLAARWSPWLAALVLALGAWSMALAPGLRVLRWLARAPELHGHRARALALVLAGVTAAGVLGFAVPLPHRSHAPGLVWLPDDALVRAPVDGVVEAIVAADGSRVAPGTVIARLSDDRLDARLQALRAELERRQIERLMQFQVDAAAAATAEDQIAQLQAEFAELQARRDRLEVRATREGTLVIDVQRVRPGLYLAHGELLAQVLPDGAAMVRAFVHNDDIARFATVPPARVALAHGGPVWPGHALAERPRADRQLPSAALGEPGGGSIPVDPADPSGRTAAEPRLLVDLALPQGAVAPVGTRALVSFDHGSASLAELAVQGLRRLFLGLVST